MADDPNTAASAETAPTLLKERAAVQERLLLLAERARREFLVFSPQLDARLFNTQELTQRLTSFAARDRHNRAYILVEDADQALRDNDRMVRLCRQMSDLVQMRRVGEEHLGLRELFVVVDHLGYLHQPDITNPEWVSALSNPRGAVPLAERFHEMWDRSEPIGAIHTVGL